MTRHVKKPASAEQRPAPTTKTVEHGSHPALIALARLLARQVAAELISGALPVDELVSLTSPPNSQLDAVSPEQKDMKP